MLASATRCLSTPMRIGPPLPDSIVDLRVNSTTITSHHATHLRKAAGSEDFFLWHCTNYGWGTSTISLVDWDAHLAAIRRLSISSPSLIFNGSRPGTNNTKSTRLSPSFALPADPMTLKRRKHTFTDALVIYLSSVPSSMTFKPSMRPNTQPQPSKPPCSRV
jgi:hypothetical protein